MNAIASWFTDPMQFQFFRHALGAVLIMGLLCGALGTFVVLRGWSFFGDALTHAVFPGVVVAQIVGGSFFAGGLVAGLLTSLAIGVVARSRRVTADTAIGVLFVGAFSLGVFLLSRTVSYRQDLSAFLFGQVLGVSTADLVVSTIMGTLVIGITLAIFKELKLAAFDPVSAAAMGYPVFALDLLLLGLLTVTIVVALKTVGNILVLAMIVTPAATARLYAERLSSMMLFAAALGAIEGVLGLFLAAHLDVPPGSTIVLLATAVFLAGLGLSPRGGLPAYLRQRRASAAERPDA